MMLQIKLVVVLAAMVFFGDETTGSLTISDNLQPKNNNQWAAKNAATGLCLDTKDDGDVYAEPCNGGWYQLWESSENDLGHQIRNVQTHLCLDSNSQGEVYALSCNGGIFQRWVVMDMGGRVFHNSGTGLCLDSNASGSVYATACNGGVFQRWQ